MNSLCMSVGEKPPKPRANPRKVLNDLSTYLVQYDDWDPEEVAELMEIQADATRAKGPILEARREHTHDG